MRFAAHLQSQLLSETFPLQHQMRFIFPPSAVPISNDRNSYTLTTAVITPLQLRLSHPYNCGYSTLTTAVLIFSHRYPQFLAPKPPFSTTPVLPVLLHISFRERNNMRKPKGFMQNIPHVRIPKIGKLQAQGERRNAVCKEKHLRICSDIHIFVSSKLIADILNPNKLLYFARIACDGEE